MPSSALPWLSSWADPSDPAPSPSCTWFDALSLGFFTVAGATRAMNAGLGFLPCLLLGVITAVGGGSLRDIFSGHAPRIFKEGELYALVSAIAALLFLGVQHLGIDVDRAAIIGTVSGFGIRMLAVRYGWRTSSVSPIFDPVSGPPRS